MGGDAMDMADLHAWPAPSLGVLGRKTHRTWASLHPRSSLGPGERKSLQPTAARPALSGHGRLRRFIGSPAWPGF